PSARAGQPPAPAHAPSAAAIVAAMIRAAETVALSMGTLAGSRSPDPVVCRGFRAVAGVEAGRGGHPDRALCATVRGFYAVGKTLPTRGKVRKWSVVDSLSQQ